MTQAQKTMEQLERENFRLRESIKKYEEETSLALKSVNSLELQKKNLEKALAESEKTIVNLKLSLETQTALNNHANECINQLTKTQ